MELTTELKTAGLSFLYEKTIFFCVLYDKLMTGPVRTDPVVFLLGFRKQEKDKTNISRDRGKRSQ